MENGSPAGGSPTSGEGGAAGLLLILSPERSGSTLLSLMLGGHRRVVAPPELHLLRFAGFDDWRRGYPVALDSLRSLLAQVGETADPASLAERFSGWRCEEVYRWLCRRCGPGRIVVDKTPAYARSRETLERAEGLEPFYVHLVRHPLGVAASRIQRRLAKRRASRSPATRARYLLARLERLLGSAPPREVRREVAYWTEVHERLERFLHGIDERRWTRLHFEELVRRPREVLAALCHPLGLEPEPAMLQPAANAPPGLRWGLGDEKVLRRPGIDPGVADRWRRRLGDRRLDPRCTGLMQRLGVER